MNEVYSFLKENVDLSKNKYLVVGVSGGADSMALLHILKNYCDNSNCQVVCVHIHHNLRKESDEEQKFVSEYCDRNQIIFETIKFTYEERFTENIGREKRYRFFEEILKKYQSKYLFTAHHGDDLIETMLMRLVRGSSLKGISGIPKKSKRSFYTILRPLLFMTKQDIYNYVENYKIPYVEDISNQDSHYTRNRYRKEILPFLKKENSNVHLKFLDCSEELQEMLKYIESITDDRYEKIVKDNKLDWKLWLQEDSFIQKEILKRYLFEIYKENIIKITKNHFKILIEFISNGTINTAIDFPCEYEILKGYQEISFEKKEEVNDYCYVLEDTVKLPNNHTISIIKECNDTSNFVTYLDSSMVSLPLSVRNYNIGDKISIKNMNGHKKIGDIFTDEKVPKNERKTWPVVVDKSGTIIWLPGLKKTQFDRKKAGIYDIILKYY